MPTKKDKHGDVPKRRYQPRNVQVADWEQAGPELLRRVIGRVSAQGGAVRFGYTSDGGAYAIGIYGDGEPYTVYVRPSEDIDATLAGIAEAWE